MSKSQYDDTDGIIQQFRLIMTIPLGRTIITLIIFLFYVIVSQGIYVFEGSEFHRIITTFF